MRFTRAAVATLAAIGLAAATATPAAAIRYGEPDGDDHPYVGLMLATDADGNRWRCSGTLVSPTIYLTAGHCTFGAVEIKIWFDEDVESTAYPTGGEAAVAGQDDIYTHPDYDDAAFYLNDLGVVELDEPVAMETYGILPVEGYFDDFFVKRGVNKQLFTAVGYGLQRSMPGQTGLTEAERVRLQATLQIINQDAAFGERKPGNSVLFTNNAATGGTCSGDSGGPIFVEGTTIVAAVTSYGINARCAGTGGGYRVDTPDDLDWLEDVFGLQQGQNW